MLEKILKITITIDSCKRLDQLERCLILIDNFERDEKLINSKIITDLMKYYSNKYSEIERKCNSKPKKFEIGMTLNEYQKKAMSTCMVTSGNISYMLLNLVGEVGEFASKIAKGIRKKELAIKNNDLVSDSKIIPDDELKKEAGDILWQLSGLCEVMGWTLEEVAQMNLDKLSSRKERKVIDGDGDNR